MDALTISTFSCDIASTVSRLPAEAQGLLAGAFLPPVATKLEQSPWFLKTPKACQPFLHCSFEVGRGGMSTTTMSPVRTLPLCRSWVGGEQSLSERPSAENNSSRSGAPEPELSVARSASSGGSGETPMEMLKTATFPSTTRHVTVPPKMAPASSTTLPVGFSPLGPLRASISNALMKESVVPLPVTESSGGRGGWASTTTMSPAIRPPPMAACNGEQSPAGRPLGGSAVMLSVPPELESSVTRIAITSPAEVWMLNLATVPSTARHVTVPRKLPATTDSNDIWPLGFSPLGPLRASIWKLSKRTAALPLPVTESSVGACALAIPGSASTATAISQTVASGSILLTGHSFRPSQVPYAMRGLHPSR